MKYKTIRIKTKSLSIYCKVYGKGKQKIILVHGGPAMFGYMDSLGKMLASRYKIFEYAQRGTRRSPSEKPFTVLQHVKDLRNVVEYVGDSSDTSLLGHSWGGILTLAYLSKYQGTVKSGIVLGTGPLDYITMQKFSANIDGRLSYTDYCKRKKIDEEIAEAKTKRIIDRLTDKTHKIIYPVYSYNQNVHQSLKYDKADMTIFGSTYQSMTKEGKNGNLISRLKNIKEPILAIHGDYDPIPHEGILPKLRKQVKNVKIVLLKESGHMCWLEKTTKTQTISVISKFLNQRH